MVLICIYLRVNDVEHLCMCPLAMSISSLKKCLLRRSTHFLISFFLMLELLWAIYIAWILTIYCSYYWQIFSYFADCLFCFADGFLCYAKAFKYNYLLLLFSPCLRRQIPSKKYYYSVCQRVFCLCFLLGVLWFPVLYLSI